MISLEGHRIVDLSWELVSRVTRMDQTVEEGKRDVYNMPWIVEETYNEQDGTIEHLVACNAGTVAAWPVGGVSGHICLLYTSPSPRDATLSRMPSSA